MLFRSRSFSIGTFNVDPRSANLNTEMALMCDKSPEMTAFVRKSVEARLPLSQLLDDNGQPADGSNVLEGSGLGKVMLFLFSLAPSTVADFLL